MGTVAVAAGWNWGALLLTYFLANTLVSRYRTSERMLYLSGVVAKGGARDAAQVLCNGLVFALAAAAQLIAPGDYNLVCAAGSLGASTADTWATEIGTRPGNTPRSIVTGKSMQPGMSGGVSTLGTLAGVAGAVLLASIAMVLGAPAAYWPAIVCGGIAGSLIDSILGAAVQQRRYCPSCNRVTERAVHSCGAATSHHSGVLWVNNDVVNLIATTTGAIVALGLAFSTGSR